MTPIEGRETALARAMVGATWVHCAVCDRRLPDTYTCPHHDDDLCSACCGCDHDLGPIPGQTDIFGGEVTATHTGTTTIPRSTP